MEVSVFETQTDSHEDEVEKEHGLVVKFLIKLSLLANGNKQKKEKEPKRIIRRRYFLGVNISCNLNFGKCVESKAKVAAKKLGILNKVRRYFTPGQRLALYQAQVRTSMEYCSHLLGGSAKYQFEALDSVDRSARRIIGDKLLTQAKLHSLQHLRNVACLSVFFRIYFGECAQELHNLVPPSPFYHRTARHHERWHPYVVDIPSTRTKRFLSTFLIRAAKMLNALPATVFPATYNLSTFKARVNRHF
ncbi:jg25120 [Pararge aegeria aegeria]|uniref:Jg25120 protein n=1 Tax=Pararge aegeria aegeria TaxID=348720 RepID=A0A8S4RWP3_9NEOP|nr:jg25120 [Pararge aegeria aegeria]